ncbi:Ldh family oxidoreductase [Paenalcaligenes niemegkensis]|uniref:Ldh family oxidoreductase n=1 Tax=Paenalcaligenes niemegkensis TaxID=2895469 RepID=UPI001EE92F9C|nr:Ldh family oxidoreductase [Paenalcaligenes niemegkensis]MCQ9618094.1 Ldh family oxidoreductase [Paenalcaligenes niemegkensis]
MAPIQSEKHIWFSEVEVRELISTFLLAQGLNQPQVDSMANMLTAAQRDGSLSHGLQRLPGTLDTMAHPRFNKQADPQVQNITPVLTRVDAHHGFSCLAAERGMSSLISSARDFGVGLLAVNNGFHSTALWPLVEQAANSGVAAMSMNPTHNWVVPSGGRSALLGTNPIAFAWPRPNSRPYVFDFATSAAARADIAMARNKQQQIPDDWGLDRNGQATTDPAEVLAGSMLPFGAHKGSAISTMIELLAGPMIGDRSSYQSKQFDADADAAPCHGELFIAFSPELTGGPDALHEAEAIFNGFTDQGARLPGNRRYQARDTSARMGIPVSVALMNRIRSLIP